MTINMISVAWYLWLDKVVYSWNRKGACVLTAVLLCLFFSRDQDNAIIRPLPRVKRLLSDSTCLPHITQVSSSSKMFWNEQKSDLLTYHLPSMNTSKWGKHIKWHLWHPAVVCVTECYKLHMVSANISLINISTLGDIEKPFCHHPWQPDLGNPASD